MQQPLRSRGPCSGKCTATFTSTSNRGTSICW
jgi:hypothetical protein